MSGTLRVGLLFGGRSVEHEVSVQSARGVAAAMRSTALQCVPLAVTTEGHWLSPSASRALLDGGATRVEASAATSGAGRVAIEPAGRRLLLLASDRPPEPLEIDVLFPLVHGWGGEDGRLQGALDLAGVPYVGAGVLGSAVGMDKSATKRLWQAHGLPVGPWLAVSRADGRSRPDAVEARIVDTLGLPLFVKPANGGSSVGISRVAERSGLREALELAFAHDREAVIERAIDAREIECAVLGNDDPQASGLGEIVPSREFYDYAAKYLDGTSRLLIPAELDAVTSERMRELALAAYRALKLQGFARIDFLLDRVDGTPYLNEANTLPGFTSISMFPKLWEAAGLAYPALIEQLVELALEREGCDG